MVNRGPAAYVPGLPYTMLCRDKAVRQVADCWKSKMLASTLDV